MKTFLLLTAILVPTSSFAADIIQAKKDIPISPNSSSTVLIPDSKYGSLHCDIALEAREIPGQRISMNSKFTVVSPKTIDVLSRKVNRDDLAKYVERLGGITFKSDTYEALKESIYRKGGIINENSTVSYTEFDIYSLQSQNSLKVKCESDGPFSYKDIVTQILKSENFDFYSEP